MLEDETRARVGRTGWGWLLSATVMGYALFIHQGLGAAREGMAGRSWHPSGFLREMEFLEPLGDHWLLGIVVFALLPALATLATWTIGRTALATALSASGLASVSIMAFYGLSPALRIWEFFHWRASLIFAATGVAIGFTLTAPLLAQRWSRLRPAWKMISYLPIYLATTSMLRNSTGTDENLFLNLSPWPAIAVIGLEIIVHDLVALWVGLSLGVWIWVSTNDHHWLRTLGVIGSAALPILFFRPDPIREDFEMILGLFSGILLLLLLVLLTHSNHPDSERKRRAANLFLGACLAGLPLFAGHALVDGDYSNTRDIRAREIIDALDAFYEREESYPEDLAELIEGRYLDRIPLPRVGYSIYHEWGWLPEPAFEYRNLGPNYLLEFSATGWVMCSYNPPWKLEEDEIEDAEDRELLVESWTCPDGRPDLW